MFAGLESSDGNPAACGEVVADGDDVALGAGEHGVEIRMGKLHLALAAQSVSGGRVALAGGDELHARFALGEIVQGHDVTVTESGKSDTPWFVGTICHSGLLIIPT